MKKHEFTLSTNKSLKKVENVKISRQTLDKKKRKLSSQIWLRRHINDKFTAAAIRDGYISRAAYKLLEIDKTYNFLKNSKSILDLGCSPGSWSQVVSLHCLSSADIIGIDKLEIKANISHKGFNFIQGDFEDEEVLNQINNRNFDLILSDIAPEASGDHAIDRIRQERILESIIIFSRDHLMQNGMLIMKSLYGADYQILKGLRQVFKKINRFKPSASRKESTEIYLVCHK